MTCPRFYNGVTIWNAMKNQTLNISDIPTLSSKVKDIAALSSNKKVQNAIGFANSNVFKNITTSAISKIPNTKKIFDLDSPTSQKYLVSGVNIRPFMR